MHVITYKGRPVTLEKLQDLGEVRLQNLDNAEREMFLSAGTRRKTIAVYLWSLGYTWAERIHGIECQKVTL